MLDSKNNQLFISKVCTLGLTVSIIPSIIWFLNSFVRNVLSNLSLVRICANFQMSFLAQIAASSSLFTSKCHLKSNHKQHTINHKHGKIYKKDTLQQIRPQVATLRVAKYQDKYKQDQDEKSFGRVSKKRSPPFFIRAKCTWSRAAAERSPKLLVIINFEFRLTLMQTLNH